MERNINHLPPTHPQLQTWPTTQGIELAALQFTEMLQLTEPRGQGKDTL